MSELKELQVIPVSEALKSLPGVGRTTAYAMVKDGRIPGLKIGERWCIEQGAFQRALEGGGCGKKKRGRPAAQQKRAA